MAQTAIDRTPLRIPCSSDAALQLNISDARIVGHILEMTFTNGNIKIEPGYHVRDPKAPDGPPSIPVLGVFDYFEHDNAELGEFIMQGLVSDKSREGILEARESAKGGKEVQLKVVIYKYYTLVKPEVYYERVLFEEPILFKVGSKFEIGEEMVGDNSYQFDWRLIANSEGKEQKYTLATSPTKKKQVTVGVHKA